MDKSTIKKELSIKMDNSIKVLDQELKGLRTGRASINLLDPVMVESYETRMPLSQVATISTPDARTITIQVWDKNMTKSVEKAIAESNLGLNPYSDGTMVRITIPPLSEERRKDLVKLAHKYGEDGKIAIRNIRRDGMEELKKLEKSHSISEDEHHSLSNEVQKLTDEYIAKIDNIIKQKEKDILTI